MDVIIDGAIGLSAHYSNACCVISRCLVFASHEVFDRNRSSRISFPQTSLFIFILAELLCKLKI